MNFFKSKYLTCFFSSLAAVVLIDQTTKYFAQKNPHLFDMHINSFGSFQIIFALVIFVLVIKVLLPHIEKYPLETAIFIGGGLSNNIDRIVLGHVRDWMIIPFTNIYNNVADWALFLGLILLFWRFYANRNTV